MTRPFWLQTLLKGVPGWRLTLLALEVLELWARSPIHPRTLATRVTFQTCGLFTGQKAAESAARGRVSV